MPGTLRPRRTKALGIIPIAAAWLAAAPAAAWPGLPGRVEVGVKFEGIPDHLVVDEPIDGSVVVIVHNRTGQTVRFSNFRPHDFDGGMRVALSGTDGRRSLQCRIGEGCRPPRIAEEIVSLGPGETFRQAIPVWKFRYFTYAGPAGQYTLTITASLPGGTPHTATFPFRVLPMDPDTTVADYPMARAARFDDPDGPLIRLRVVRLNGQHVLYGVQCERPGVAPLPQCNYSVFRLGDLGRSSAVTMSPQAENTAVAHLRPDGSVAYLRVHPSMGLSLHNATSADIRKPGKPGEELREWIRSVGAELLDGTSDAALRRAIDADRRFAFGKGD